jgi:carbamoyl-phosphate synthase large subunit
MADRPVVRVLVTGAGGPSAVGILRSLAATGSVESYAADIDPHAAGLYLVPPDRRLLLPRGDDPSFAPTLLAWCLGAGIDVVYPTVDQELLPVARHRTGFETAGIGLVLAEEATLATCLDKWLLYQACRDRVPVPRTALLDETFEATLAAGAWAFPFVVKPRAGSGSRGVEIIRDATRLSTLPRDGSQLVQELLPGDEHSLDVLASPHGEVAAVVPRLRLKVDSGVAVAARTVHDPVLDRLARDVAATVGLSWVANVQVRADVDGRPRLLEINPRFPGTMPLTIAAGIDMPRICLDMALGAPLPVVPDFRDVAIVRYLEERVIDPADLERVPRAGEPALIGAP